MSLPATHRHRRRGWGLEAALLAAMAAAVAVVFFTVDLSPRVESDFFFATDDPQLQTSLAIDERFPSAPQLILRAAGGDVRSPAYAAAVGELTGALAQVAGVESVQSLSRGPASPAAAFDSPFWRRLLVPEGEGATNLVVLLSEEGAADAAATVAAVEEAVARSELAVEISGVPYVVELIRRYLRRDLQWFSIAALVVFGIIVGALYRSPRLVVGTLATCLTACAATLGVLGVADFRIGVLTANLVTIVFVLTLSHTVFVTANWRRLASAPGAAPREALRQAVGITFPASFWCMACALLTFLSLLFATAKPLRELGATGAVGAAVALVVTYTFYPPFLRHAWARPVKSLFGGGEGRLALRPGLVVIAVCLAVGTGVVQLSTDPSLLSYFRQGSELRDGLELIDADGGSSPLSLVVRHPEGERLDSEEAVSRLKALQEALEAEPAVGVALSAVPLLAEARQASPLAAFLPARSLLDLLQQPAYDQVALAFMSPDRLSARFFLRMREAARDEPRRQAMERIAASVRQAGLAPELVGGLYDLQGKLASLVSESLVQGLAGLLLLFFFIGAWVSRSLRVGGAMLVSLILVPLFLLGAMGYLGLPVDFISSPGANVAIGIGVDSMIQMAVIARRERRKGASARHAWLTARSHLGGAVAGASLVIAVGFGLFGLSSFPPTQRFGVAVVLGMMAAAAAALLVLPPLAGGRVGANRPESARDPEPGNPLVVQQG